MQPREFFYGIILIVGFLSPEECYNLFMLNVAICWFFKGTPPNPRVDMYGTINTILAVVVHIGMSVCYVECQQICIIFFFPEKETVCYSSQVLLFFTQLQPQLLLSQLK